ncbi:unnamed protein product [Ilex paraguariensis]|uniref:NmrA-like domain-containing protein n=1 Tax=Ilex paraguariensis TaxID=185542 RepID=A0ABC8TB84_9AQUA
MVLKSEQHCSRKPEDTCLHHRAFQKSPIKTHAVEPAASVFKTKTQIRRTIEAEGIPYTYVACNALAAYFLPNLGQLDDATSPPRDKVVILGDGNSKAIFVKEEDVATYTIKAVDDPRTLNKLLYMSPPANIMSFNELVSLWENKIGKTLERTYILEDQLLKNIQEAPMPLKFFLSICYAAFVKGDVSKIEVDASVSVEASHIYPEVKYTTVDEFLNQLRSQAELTSLRAEESSKEFMIGGSTPIVVVEESKLCTLEDWVKESGSIAIDERGNILAEELGYTSSEDPCHTLAEESSCSLAKEPDDSLAEEQSRAERSGRSLAEESSHSLAKESSRAE